MNEYNFNVKFDKGRISSNLRKLVQNDYNSTKINFTFDKEGRKLFKMLYPDGTSYIIQIDNNELIFGPGVLSQDGTYEVEIVLYTEDGRLTDYATTNFEVRAELIQSDEIVEVDDRLPILDSLIGDVNKIKEDAENGLFNGEKGETGASAYDIYLSNGGTLTENEWLESLKGERGKDGQNGQDGQDGYTPIKGTDYWTNEDKKEIESYIDDKLGVIENAYY